MTVVSIVITPASPPAAMAALTSLIAETTFVFAVVLSVATSPTLVSTASTSDFLAIVETAIPESTTIPPSPIVTMLSFAPPEIFSSKPEISCSSGRVIVKSAVSTEVAAFFL